MSDSPLNNAGHFARVEEILTRRTTISSGKDARFPGVRRSFDMALNAEDMEYFKSALVFKNPKVNLSVFQGADDEFLERHHREAARPEQVLVHEMLSGNPRLEEYDPVVGFTTVLTDYIKEKMGMLIMSRVPNEVDNDRGGIISMTPQPYAPVNIAKMTSHLQDLKKKANLDPRSLREDKPR